MPETQSVGNMDEWMTRQEYELSGELLEVTDRAFHIQCVQHRNSEIVD